MKRRSMILGALAGLSAQGEPQADAKLKEQVAKSERGFAATMARRDAAAFAAYLSDEAVFLGDNPNQPVLRGKRAIVEAWKRYFEGPAAPFSWEPDTVEVLDSGKLALTSGPVRNPKGETIARFTSIWRAEPDGQWRVVFDRGCPACRCA
jgi:ketosteroid isomerase-like protein